MLFLNILLSDLKEEWMVHLSPENWTKLAVCCRVLWNGLKEEVENYRDIGIYRLAIHDCLTGYRSYQIRMSMQVRILNDKNEEFTEDSAFVAFSIEGFYAILGRVVADARERHSRFQVSVGFIKACGIQWESRYRVYTTNLWRHMEKNGVERLFAAIDAK